VELIVVRHAEPVRITSEEGGGAPVDPKLTPAGHDQAARLARWLAHERIDHIVSSPLARAYQTAAPVAHLHGLDVEILDGLREYDSESDSYIPVEELKATNDPRWDAMVSGDWQSFGGEPPAEFRSRIVAHMDTIVSAHQGETVVVVCHGGVVNIYLGSILGIVQPLWFDPAYTSISRVRANRTGIRSVASVNEVGHLIGTRDTP
jgi:probable phosphoglycerate mutase